MLRYPNPIEIEKLIEGRYTINGETVSLRYKIEKNMVEVKIGNSLIWKSLQEYLDVKRQFI